MLEHAAQTGASVGCSATTRPLTGAIATTVWQPAKIINIVRLHRTAKM